MMVDSKEQLESKPVYMALDGWSNVYNEPVVCVSVTRSDGDTYLSDTLDTSGNGHTLGIFDWCRNCQYYHVLNDSNVA